MKTYDVAIIGGGIIGTSAAAFLAEAGRSVVLVERSSIAAGASGRNSGVVQHPFDPSLAALHRTSLELYRELGDSDPDFTLDDPPAGVLLLTEDAGAARRAVSEMELYAPELHAVALGGDELRALEPMLADGLSGCRLETGYPIGPAAATLAYARRAEHAGAHLVIGEPASVLIEHAVARGVRLASGEWISSGAVLLAGGPWTSELVGTWVVRPPIRPVWGVVVSGRLANRPSHVLEELGIDRRGGPPEALFSLVSVGLASSIGSTFSADEPDLARAAEPVVERAALYVQALAGMMIESVRACARPASFDGRPLIGPVGDVSALYVCAGHGPWGISTGPASARLVCDQITRAHDVVADFDPARWPANGVTA